MGDVLSGYKAVSWCLV